MKTLVFDWKRTLYDPEKKELYPGSISILKYLKTNKQKVVLIGKGGDDMKQEVERLKIFRLFDDMVFTGSEKNENVYRKYINNRQKSNTYIIGDRIKNEIKIGNKLGATTIWIKFGKFSNEVPELLEETPVFTVHSLSELQILLKFI